MRSKCKGWTKLWAAAGAQARAQFHRLPSGLRGGPRPSPAAFQSNPRSFASVQCRSRAWRASARWAACRSARVTTFSAILPHAERLLRLGSRPSCDFEAWPLRGEGILAPFASCQSWKGRLCPRSTARRNLARFLCLCDVCSCTPMLRRIG